MSNFRPPLLALLVLGILLPDGVRAAVQINEVAWMGTSDNANAEWIELYNDGVEPVNLSGWTVTTSGTAPVITLSGTVGAGGFYLLERTSDASVPGISADQIYTGALSNAGLILFLKNAGGSIIDQVEGGTNWSTIGGDNVTKHTPQRSGSGWITAAPTPKAANATGSSAAPTATTTPSTSDTATTTPGITIGGTPVDTSVLVSPIARLHIDPGPHRIVHTNVAEPYRAVVYTGGRNLNTTARVTWSFGNGVRALGRNVSYAYTTPGEYAVVVRASTEDTTAVRTLAVTVQDAQPVIAEVSEQGITLVNEDDLLLDISGWILRAEDVEFVFPDDTVLLPHGRVLFTPDVTGLPPAVSVALLYPNDTIAASYDASETLVLQPFEERSGIEEVTSVIP